MIGVNPGNFLPTDQELELVAQIYSQAGRSRPGHINGATVVEMLSSAVVDLPPLVLTAIWDIADDSKSGYLSETRVAVALRLIGWAQSGQKVTAGLVNECGPPPRVRGLAEGNAVPLEWPPFTESMKNASQKHFEACGPVYGLLEGDKARDVFIVFDLAPKDIWKIWDIADTQKRGALDKYDFALAIYLIKCIQTGQLSAIPPTTPPQVYEQIRSVSDSPTCPPPPSPQVLNPPVRPRKPTRPPPPPINTFKVLPETSPRSTPSTSNPGRWSVSPSTKANAERHFDELDTSRVGYIEEGVVAQFMRGFELIPEDLALIWDLSDLNHDYCLSRDEFVIAMHLIEQRINGVQLPSVLPASLLPPSLREQPPHSALRPSATSPNHMKSMPRAHSNTISGNPPLPPKPTYSSHPSRYSVPASKDKAVSPRSHFSLQNGFQSTVIPEKLLSAVNSESGPQTIDAEQYRALEQQNASLFLKVEELSAQISARQGPHVSSKHVSLEQYQALEERSSLLSMNIRDLTCQIDVLRDVQSRNETLSQDKAQLLAKIQEMEQITSDLLQSNEAYSILGQLEVDNTELNQRVSELEQLRPQLEDATRRLRNVLEENRDLSQRLREARESAKAESVRAAMELHNMKENMEVLKNDKQGLQDRADTLERVIVKAASVSKTMPEMEVLMGDITRENEALKQRLREMESSTARLLLSTNGEAEQEKLRSTNKQLTSRIRELEQLLIQLQQSSEEIELQRVLKDVTIENDQLKGSLRETELEVTRLQQTARRVGPLEAEVEELKAEIRRLHCENVRAQAPAEESPIAPPAYDDDSFH